jgi:hypothetical protein
MVSLLVLVPLSLLLLLSVAPLTVLMLAVFTTGSSSI